MSAIIAGTCTKCGKKFHISVGTPNWYNRWLKTGIKNDGVEAFQNLRKRQICITCDPEAWRKMIKGEL